MDVDPTKTTDIFFQPSTVINPAKLNESSSIDSTTVSVKINSTSFIPSTGQIASSPVPPNTISAEYNVSISESVPPNSMVMTLGVNSFAMLLVRLQ